MPLSFTTSFSNLSYSSSTCPDADKYKNPELGTDYGADFDIMVLLYIYENWCIETPAELIKPTRLPADVDDKDSPDYVPNSYMRFRRGFPDNHSVFQVCALQGDTPEGSIRKESTGKGAWSGITDVWITLKAGPILERDAVDIENDQFTFLGIMERNVERICRQYRHGGLTGIMDLDWAGGGRIYEVKDNWASSLWGSKWKIKVMWYKVNEAG